MNLIEDLRKYYKAIEDRVHPSGNITGTYTTPVNFKESLNCPIHRWYAYKEGFSPSFVKGFIQQYSTSPDSVVFDPYGGVGTTVLAANELGFQAYSLDVSPLGNFASRVKNAKYTKADLKHLQDTIARFDNFVPEFEDRYSISKTVISYFHSDTYKAIIGVRNYVDTIPESKIKDIFMLALLSGIESVSTHKKNGNGVKRKVHPPLPTPYDAFKELIISRLNVFVGDICNLHKTTKNQIIEGSCIEDYSLPKKADIVLTSPPYANCFDYSKVYLVELWLGGFFKNQEDQQRFREKSVISHVHYRWKRADNESVPIVESTIVPLLKGRDLWSNSIPSMLTGYFRDMKRCLINLSKNINPGATIGFVVGNPTYAGVVVATDLILAGIAESVGYECQGITIYRKVVPSSQQTKLIEDCDQKYVRESMVILKWPK